MRAAAALLLAAGLAVAGDAFAHGFELGSVRIDHPYALPAVAGDRSRIYFRTLKNFKRAPGAIVGARSPDCQRVEVVGAGGAGSPIAIPGRAATRYRHDQPQHLACVRLRRGLVDGDELPMTLDFGAAGTLEITVYVQQPRLSW